jgi:hypothetical protein
MNTLLADFSGRVSRRLGSGTLKFYVIWIALLGSTTVARADVTPPGTSGSNDEVCTLAKSCPDGQECVWCNSGYSDIKLCARNLEPLEFAMRCRPAQSGAIRFWNELWCRPASGARDASVTLSPLDGGTKTGGPTDFEQTQQVNVCPAAAAVDVDRGGCSVSSRSLVSSRTGSHFTTSIGLISTLAWLGLLVRTRASQPTRRKR